ncbi:pilus assembly PilX family protein [Ramlibacter rhizophilus]|uniref:Type 4 fimbrial biogenesis protein PilX N-terminal domain-containing protein n=1 Tax=Ramlibacter rhizophilus TaxID=1781167 RepID=A0A4Z0BUD0_9BURK|nr:PilX N-terminal domain-containing pilus assembly protein [Ramlibacter rhizophilus]TFZ01589.1 hypothetical protein EZ242_09480 [Ramlibacter rhizophilus]
MTPCRTRFLRSTPTAQRGATLVVALIFLVLLSVFAINAFNSSTTNVRVVGNMQSRQEAIAAANLAIETVISSTAFSTTPATVAATPINVDIDKDGANDYVVNMTPQPTCYRVRPIKNYELNAAVETDRVCLSTSGNGGGGHIEYPSGSVSVDDSLCATTEWNLRAVVTDARSAAQVAVNQGAGLKILTADASSYCN